MTGIYIHIPFCKSRCLYCDFFSTTQLHRRKEYVHALLQEIADRQDEMHDVRTVYFGGGTPGLLDAEDIVALLDALPYAPDSEVTLEANPGDLTEDRARALRQAGINRLSIGIQSFSDRLLQNIGRRHTAQEACDAVRFAQQAGFDNLSVDMMYGLPEQSLNDWRDDLQQAMALHVQHLSAYCLTYEAGTPMTRLLEQGQITETDEETENAMYDTLCDTLAANKFEHYEVSNFAQSGYHSKHNSSYWNNAPYIGLGAGAHSYDGRRRSWNPADLDRYIGDITGRTLQREGETLTDEQHRTERIMLGLRTRDGINAKDVTGKQDCVERYVRQGMLQCSAGRISATRSGLHILNRIIEDLL